MGLTGQPRSDFDTSTSTTGPAGNHPRPPMPLVGKANGRMHHHDKHAATKDGHRADDPHGVTGWKQQEMDALTQRQSEIQSVMDEPNIQREGHEVFDENANYDQRVTAFGDIERDKSEVNQGDWDDDSDQLETEMGRGEEFDDGDEPGYIKDPSNAYARKATYGQDMPPPPPPTSSKSSGPTGPPLSKWEQDHANVQNKRNVADVQQWHKDKASDKKVSDRLGIPTPPRQAPKWRDDPAPPPPR